MHRLRQSLREGNFFCIVILHHAFQFLCIFQTVISFPQFSITPLLSLSFVHPIIIPLSSSSLSFILKQFSNPHLLLLCMYHLASLTHIPFLPLLLVLLTVLPLCIPSSPLYFKSVYINITGYWLINNICHMLTMSSMSTIYKPTAPSTRSAASEYTKK